MLPRWPLYAHDFKCRRALHHPCWSGLLADFGACLSSSGDLALARGRGQLSAQCIEHNTWFGTLHKVLRTLSNATACPIVSFTRPLERVRLVTLCSGVAPSDVVCSTLLQKTCVARSGQQSPCVSCSIRCRWHSRLITLHGWQHQIAQE